MTVRRLKFGWINGEGELWDDPEGPLVDYCEYDKVRTALTALWHETIESGNSQAHDYGWPNARKLTLEALGLPADGTEKDI